MFVTVMMILSGGKLKKTERVRFFPNRIKKFLLRVILKRMAVIGIQFSWVTSKKTLLKDYFNFLADVMFRINIEAPGCLK